MFSYIHIPFCESKCKYCRFASTKTNQSLINIYISHLLKEISNFKKSSFYTNELLNSIYFWWWTPSILKTDELKTIIDKMNEVFTFKKNIEITLETTPQNITIEKLKSYHKLWINRLSIWLQTLNNKTLQAIWRKENEYIFSRLEILKKSPIKNISIDFIIWLPYVKRWEILKNIDYILSKYKFIKHISVYMLEDYYEVIDPLTLYDNISYPDDWKKKWIDEKYYNKEYLEIKNYLYEKWFLAYEISNFAKKWFYCKHNKSYWNHKNNIWFWLWAHSFISNNRFSNSESFLDYYKWKLFIQEKLNKKDLIIEKTMFQLRTSWLKQNIIKYLDQEKLNFYLKNKFLIKQKNKIIINDKKKVFLDTILSEIIKIT